MNNTLTLCIQEDFCYVTEFRIRIARGSRLGAESTVLSSSEAVWKQAGRTAAVERGGSWHVEMENDNNRSPSLFSTYSVLSTVTHFSIFSLKMTDASLWRYIMKHFLRLLLHQPSAEGSYSPFPYPNTLLILYPMPSYQPSSTLKHNAISSGKPHLTLMECSRSPCNMCSSRHLPFLSSMLQTYINLHDYLINLLTWFYTLWGQVSVLFFSPFYPQSPATPLPSGWHTGYTYWIRSGYQYCSRMNAPLKPNCDSYLKTEKCKSQFYLNWIFMLINSYASHFFPNRT